MAMNEVSLKDLLEAGCHFGHQARRWHPKMKPYLYAKREGVHIFDLVKTKQGLDEACAYLNKAASDGKRIAMISTKRQAQNIVKDAAKRAGVGYVTERWLGGTLTNYVQIRTSLQKLRDWKKGGTAEDARLTKKERLLKQRAMAKVERFLGGLMIYDDIPEVLFVVDTRREKVAIDEAVLKGVPVVGVVDSNCDPTDVDVVIPANDDAVKSIQLIVRSVTEAIIDGNSKWEAKQKAKIEGKNEAKSKKK